MRAATLCLAVVLVGGAAHADAGGARSHFLSGLELYSQGKYAAALEEYRAAWVSWEDPELLLDMAECNRHLGNLDEAREQYRGFLQRAPHSPLRGSVERQLARLDREQQQQPPPPAELVVVPPSVKQAAESADADARHAGRAAKALGIAGWVASAAAMALGIYTWRETASLEDAAHADLVQLHPSTGLVASSPEETAFFQSPTCSPPSSLMGTDAYRRDCNRGQQYSAATTGLFVSSLALGVAGTVSYILGARQARRARGVELAPAVSLRSAALQLRFPF
jgi:tetratricopeptide (TPR) repeat protein